MTEDYEEHSQQSDVWLAFANKLCDCFYNFSLSREYRPLLSERQEGATEQWCQDWSIASDCFSDDTTPLLATPYPQKYVTLLQFEPAWTEQLALRVAGIDYIVVNAQYAGTEATGRLPCLYDLTPDKEPVLVGRYSNAESFSKNSILSYLGECRSINFDQHLPDSSRSLAKLLETMISTDLAVSMEVLRYQDNHSWHQLYRQQCQAAGGGRTAWFQTWCLRLYGQGQRSPAERRQSTWQAIQTCRRVLELLEQQLASNDDAAPYLLGTKQPVLVDILLWGHLVVALTNVHLVIILADFPALCKFIQHIWNHFFSEHNSEDDAKLWNLQENARNQFCQSLPMLHRDHSNYPRTMDMMEHLSLPADSLHRRLSQAKDVRATQDHFLPRPFRPFETWHRWRMGDSLHPNASPRREDQKEDIEKLREYKRNDEVWMATAALGILASVFLFGVGRPE